MRQEKFLTQLLVDLETKPQDITRTLEKVSFFQFILHLHAYNKLNRAASFVAFRSFERKSVTLSIYFFFCANF